MVEWKNWDVTVGNQREIKATEIEISTTLGPYLRLSTFPDAFVSFILYIYCWRSYTDTFDDDGSLQLQKLISLLQAICKEVISNLLLQV